MTSLKEPLINLNMSQRDLKRAVARQRLPLMARVLNKNVNAANVRLRPRPSGLSRFSLAFVVLFRLNPLGLQKHASDRKKREGLRHLEVNQRFLYSKSSQIKSEHRRDINATYQLVSEVSLFCQNDDKATNN